MYLITARISFFIAVLATLVWVVQPNESCEFELHFDRISAFFLALASFILTEYSSYKKSSANHISYHPNDKLLLQELYQDIDSHNLIYFLRTHDFGASFNPDDTRPLHIFVGKWIGADKDFQDNSIEKQKKLLVASAQRLSHLIGNKTYNINQYVQSTSPKNEHGELRSEKTWQNINEINKAADDFVSKYDNFIRVCKKKIPLADK
ncbi:hypothetical protein [Desulfovermiculus halophilus]|uniref:hypothetical protein n=1 Tax=Desulfovermiculus halophilus TaxID=339722 RepID=UPI0012946A88|nr:hypothetical protein [Desulfovermiculus halophilus]